MSIGWFVDGSYMMKVWNDYGRMVNVMDRLNFTKMRTLLERELKDLIDEAYYFNAETDLGADKASAFYNALAFPPPSGPGLRVKLYSLQRRQLYWPAHLGGGPVVHPQTGVQYEQTQQKAVDVGLAFHLVRSHANRGWTKLVLCAGDSDFHEVVQYLVETRNVDLYLVGSIETISEDLRPYARRVLEVSGIFDAVRGVP